MRSRALRFALHALFLAGLAAAAYVVWQKESEATAAATAAQAFDERARAVVRSLLEIKGAQPGYVAAGQGEDYWVARVSELAAGARQSLTALKPLARTPQSAADVDAALAALEDFEQMDRRAREYVRGGQRLLASDLVFSDGIEKMDAAAGATEHARAVESVAAGAAIRASRREQLIAAGGAAALGVLIVFLLVPLPRTEAPGTRASTSEAPAGELLIAPARAASILSIAPPPVAVKSPPAEEPSTVIAPPALPAAKPATPAIDLAAIASLCTDLSRVVDTRALPGALERTASLLNASGVVIWVADPDGRELAPVMAHGYPQNLLTRMGTIAREAENATAAAFRTGLIQIVKADEYSPGAIAAPLLSPSGPLGVMAAELRQDGERREATRAAATIVAAQLATLMGPPVRTQGKAETAVRA
jgi:CHASE3 domain sensor protein